jgi:hypothetical protein
LMPGEATWLAHFFGAWEGDDASTNRGSSPADK